MPNTNNTNNTNKSRTRERACWLLVIAILAVFGYGRWREADDARAHVDRKYRETVAINDSVSARLATTSLERDDYKAFADAERVLHGKIVAGVRLRVARRDTLVVHDTLVTALNTDSTRTATFRDSSFAGVIAGTVTAPPCCGALGINYNVTRPEFNPAVAFVQAGDEFVAVVEWGGEKVEVKAPYYKPAAVKHARLKPLAPYAEGGAMFGGLGLALGTQVQLGRGWSVVGGADRVWKTQTSTSFVHREAVIPVNEYHYNIGVTDEVRKDSFRDVLTSGRLTIRKEWR